MSGAPGSVDRAMDAVGDVLDLLMPTGSQSPVSRQRPRRPRRVERIDFAALHAHGVRRLYEQDI